MLTHVRSQYEATKLDITDRSWNPVSRGLSPDTLVRTKEQGRNKFPMIEIGG